MARAGWDEDGEREIEKKYKQTDDIGRKDRLSNAGKEQRNVKSFAAFMVAAYIGSKKNYL